MIKKEIITICGNLGSGKSSTADMVAKKLEYKRFSSGDFFREIGIKKGLTVNEINKHAEKNKNIDFLVDNKLKSLNKSKKIVIDSRLAFHWIPNSFKVYLNLPEKIAKKRILENLKTNKLRAKSEKTKTIKEIYKKMKERFESEQKRYWDLYKVDNTKKENFDLIIDTNKNNLKQVVSIILKEYKKWLKKINTLA